MVPAAKRTPAVDSSTRQWAVSADRLVRLPYQSQLDQNAREYLVYLPAGYDSEPDRKWPVMLFLHGHGERGNGLDELNFVMVHGPLYEAWIRRKPLPFIIVAPQLHMFDQRENGPDFIRNRSMDSLPVRLETGVPERPEAFTSSDSMAGALPVDMTDEPVTLPIGWDLVETDLLGMLDEVERQFRTDKNRYYLTGLSYGGFGTWYLASRHPQRFAAIAPVVGWGHPDLMAPIAASQTPVWAFAGGRDQAVEVQYFYAGLNRLEELGHQDVRFTVHEDMRHDAWVRVYDSADFYSWLLSHSLAE